MTLGLELLELPCNPAPRDAHIMQVETTDGTTLRAAWWHATKKPCRGTVCILQGRAEFIEKHFEVIRDLRRRGFAVVAFDWRGQGCSSRVVANPKKGHVSHFCDYHRDLEAIERDILIPLMPKPYFGMAYSMGGAIALDMAAAQLLPFERVVAVAPMLKVFFIKAPRFTSWLASTLYWLGFAKSFVPVGGETSVSTKPFARNRLSSDPIRYGRASDTASALGPAAIGAPTIGWMRAAFRVMKKLGHKDTLNGIRTPFLLFAAGSDRVCDAHTIELAAQHLKNGTALRIPNSRHEMLLETDSVRDAFWSAFDAFIPGERKA